MTNKTEPWVPAGYDLTGFVPYFTDREIAQETQEAYEEFQEAVILISRLRRWPGARIGNPVKSGVNTISIPVYFDEPNQCDAAKKGECPYAPSMAMVNVK